MCLRADATTSAIHVRLILPGERHGDYPPRLCHTPFTRIWPHEELCRFSALVDNPWKWCASCWRKIAISLIVPDQGVLSAIACSIKGNVKKNTSPSTGSG